MGKVLTILEVSRKQTYIFASKRLRENAERSQDIAGITDSGFFARSAGDAYREADHLVSTGGGHATLQFDSREAAVTFTRRVTLAALRSYPQLELFAATVDYDPALPPGENLRRLSEALERKKARRSGSFRRLDFGVETVPEPQAPPGRPRFPGSRLPAPPPGHTWFSQPEREIRDNFLAVVHIDGNNMGARVHRLCETHRDWDACREALQAFSSRIKDHFTLAFDRMAETLAAQPDWRDQEVLPLRPIILAGDDVCFVTAGNVGLECARVFLEGLASIEDPAGGIPYAACAGVALVHRKYPFHRAYALAEELCASAKNFSAGLDPERRVSAMDWHIEFGQLRDSLAELRRDYVSEDGCLLTLRPVTMVVPGDVTAVPERGYDFFRAMSRTLQDPRIPRGKLKSLRAVLKQGVQETAFFLHDRELPLPGPAFRALPDDGGAMRCLYFDAIEMTDHFTAFEEVDA